MENGKKYLRKIMLVAMAFLLCTVCSMETKSAKAASRPTVRITKRTKKEATIKISKSKATGYQVYLSASKHGFCQNLFEICRSGINVFCCIFAII